MTGYRESGVDLEAAAKAVALIGDLARDVTRPEVVSGVGGFAGLFRLGEGRLLAAAADGVGTKTEVARLAGRLDTVGIDLVAMCADDVVCSGAEPLFFLDYIAVGAVVPDEVAAIVEGVAEGCRRAGCALLGGETAEHPGMLEHGRFDLAGFCVGTVEERALLGPDRVEVGDRVVGLSSSGLHSNGYSLVRRALLGRGAPALQESPAGLDRTLGEELLEPTAMYTPVVLELSRAGVVHSAAHVTGGGIPENLPRALPPHLGTDVEPTAWPVPPIFDVVRRAAGASQAEMFEAFNMGIGMVLVVPPGAEDDVAGAAASAGHRAHPMGWVTDTPGLRMPLPEEA